MFGYLGPNGAGKTTSLRMLLGLIRPTEGTARLFGRDPLVDGAKALDGVAGFVEGPRFYPYLSGPAQPASCSPTTTSRCSRSRIEEVLEIVELRDRAKDRVGGYSHGMRQRLGIAASLLRRPQLLLLDEPTTGLDPAGMRDMRDLVRRLAGEGITILLSSHLLLRGRGALQPGRDHPQGQRHLSGRASRPARDGDHRYRLRAVEPERARAALLAQPGVADVDAARRRRCVSPPTRTPWPR